MKKILLLLLVLFPLISVAEDAIDPVIKDEVESFWTPDVKTSTKLMIRVGKLNLLAPDEAAPAPAADAAAKKNGFMLFSRSLSEKITYNTKPKKEELNPAVLELAGCAGESLATSLGVYPLSEGSVALSVSDLKGAAGNISAKDNLELRNVKYMLKSVSMGAMVVPEMAVKESELKIKEGVTRRLIICVSVPEGSKPGSYEGVISLKSKGGQADVKLKLEVLPFKLETSPSMCFAWAMDPRNDAQFAAYKKLGCNSIGEGLEALCTGVSGSSVKLDFSNADKTVELLKKYGLTGYEQGIHTADMANAIASYLKTPELSPEFLAAYKDAATQVMAWEKSKGIKASFWIGDRVFNKPPFTGNKSMEYCLKVMKAIREVPGVRVKVNPTMDADGEAKHSLMVAELDIAGVYPNKFSAANIAAGKKKGNIDLFDAGRSRIAWGFLPWKYAAIGRTELAFMNWDEKTSKAATGVSCYESSFSPCGIFYPEKEGFLPTVPSELVRAGINDYKYIYTLETLIAAAEKGSDAAKKAEAGKAKGVLNAIKAKIPEYSEDAEKIDTQCDEFRKKIIEEIKKLQ